MSILRRNGISEQEEIITLPETVRPSLGRRTIQVTSTGDLIRPTGLTSIKLKLRLSGLSTRQVGQQAIVRTSFSDPTPMSSQPLPPAFRFQILPSSRRMLPCGSPPETESS